MVGSLLRYVSASLSKIASHVTMIKSFEISFYKDPRSAVLEYANVDFHHLLATSANQALHFPNLREQENLQVKAQKLQAACEANLNKKLEKLTPVQDFEDCCNRLLCWCSAYRCVAN